MKKFLILMAMVATFTSALAQEDSLETRKKIDPNRLVFGGIVGASFGAITFVQVSPQVGYVFNQFLTAGGGINFIYNSQKFRDFSGNEIYRFNSGFAGLNVFARAFPVNFLMVSAQPELNYSWGNVKYAVGNQPNERLEGKVVPALLVGGGLVLGAGGQGGRGGMMLSLQYDVIQNPRSPYGRNAFINVGFVF